MSFNGINSYATSLSAYIQNQTVFIVFNPNSQSFNNDTLLALNYTIGYSGAVTYNISTNTQFEVFIPGHPYNGASVSYSTPPLTTNTPYILSATVSLGTNDGAIVYINGTSTGAQTLPNNLDNPGNTLNIAYYNNNGYGPGSANYTGIISEVIIYNTILTNSQRQRVEQYLGNKWSISTPDRQPLTASDPFSDIPSIPIYVSDQRIGYVTSPNTSLLLYDGSNWSLN